MPGSCNGDGPAGTARDRAWRGAAAGAAAALVPVLFWAGRPACAERYDCAGDALMVAAIAVVLFPLVGGVAAAALKVRPVWLVTLLASVATAVLAWAAFRSRIAIDPPTWVQAAMVPVSAAVWALTAILVAPWTGRTRRWVLRGVAVAVLVALVPVAHVVGRHQDEVRRAAEFAALGVPLVQVDLAGYRQVYAEIYDDEIAEWLDIDLAPVGVDDQTSRVTARLYRQPGGLISCDTALGFVDSTGDYRCTEVAPNGWALESSKHARSAAVVVDGASLVVLFGPDRGGVPGTTLAMARLRPATAEQLARLY